MSRAESCWRLPFAGTTDPVVLADLVRKRLRSKIRALRQVLAERFRPHHAFMVSQILAHVDYLDEVIATVSERVATVIAPYAEDLTHLDTIPDVNRRTAEVLHRGTGRGHVHISQRALPRELGRSMSGPKRKCR